MNGRQEKVCFVMVGESERAKEMYKRETAAFIAYLLVCSHKKKKRKKKEIEKIKGGEVASKGGWDGKNEITVHCVKISDDPVRHGETRENILFAREVFCKTPFPRI